MWKVFVKAGKPGWAVLIPIYNVYVLLEIVGRPWWWLLLLLIPLVNFVIVIILMIDLAKSFGKGAGFGVELLFLNYIFMLIPAFGDAQYAGPSAVAIFRKEKGLRISSGLLCLKGRRCRAQGAYAQNLHGAAA